MISWDNWQTLLTVSRAGTYGKAASQLGVDATTVGRRIKRLEQLVGASLFFRHNGTLTPSGQCSKLLTHLETASESLRTIEQSHLADAQCVHWREIRITAPPFLISSLLAPTIGQLSQAQQVHIELLGTGNNVSLSRREADIALRIEDDVWQPDTLSEWVHAEILGELEFAVYQHQDAKLVELPWAGIVGEPNDSRGTQTMLKLVGDDKFHFKLKHFDGLKQILLAGAARAMLPSVMADHCTQLKRSNDGTVLSLPLWMLSHKQDESLAHINAAKLWIKALCKKSL